MTRRANARLAGFAFLFYIATGIPALMLSGRAMRGDGVAAKLATIAQHALDLRISMLLVLCGAFSALALAVSLYALTRDEDSDIAMFGAACRVVEGVVGGISIQRSQELLWLAGAGDHAPSPEVATTLGAFLLQGQGGGASALFFAVGSTAFSWLLVRGRIVPLPLAWLGVVASVLLLVALPLQLANVPIGPLATFMWLPMLAFEVPLGLWLIVKGAATPVRVKAM